MERNLNEDIEELERLIIEKSYIKQLNFIKELDLYYSYKIEKWGDEIKTSMNSWASVSGNYSEYETNSRKALRLLKLYGGTMNINVHTNDEALKIILNIFERFIVASEKLLNRGRNKNDFIIENEYDVQDLLLSYLSLFFQDIRVEEPTPSTAGNGNRIDFLLKNEKIAIETKFVRENMKLRDELLVDINCYKSHPDCKTILFFVYDSLHIKNSTQIKNDLESKFDNVKVFFARK